MLTAMLGNLDALEKTYSNLKIQMIIFRFFCLTLQWLKDEQLFRSGCFITRCGAAMGCDGEVAENPEKRWKEYKGGNKETDCKLTWKKRVLNCHHRQLSSSVR